MPPMLHDIQKNFIEHIFGQSDNITASIAAGGNFTPAQRLRVYKNNTQLILTGILLQTFPAVTKLADEKFVRYAANEFIKSHPPESADMDAYGSAFPLFLRGFAALKAHPYVADIAALEWARKESFLSPLNSFPSAESCGFLLQPHVRLLRSSWPMVDIWKLALEGGDVPDMTQREYFALTCRRANTVEVWKLEKPAFMMLDNLQDQKTYDFKTQGFMADCINCGILAIHLDSENQIKSIA